MDAKAKLAKEVTEFYSTIDGCYPCAYALYSDDGKHTVCQTFIACHMTLLWCQKGVYDNLITSFPAKNDVHLAFFDFMKNRLYRKWSDQIHLEYTEDGKPYILLTDLAHFPSKVLYNLCICSRAIVEYKARITRWANFVAKGMDPSFAFAICGCSTDELDDEVYKAGTDAEHFPVYLKMNLKSVVNGEPNLADDPDDPAFFKFKPGACVPTNRIWGDKNMDLRSLAGTTVREFYNKWREPLGLTEELA